MSAVSSVMAESTAPRLISSVDDALPADRPAIAVGDFNAEPGSETYERLLNGEFRRPLVDARRVDHVFLTQACDVREYAIDATTVDVSVSHNASSGDG
ncbi:MAG: endonuclease/exonuclease/phosphatase family protein [Haloarculaceae archaeon]